MFQKLWQKHRDVVVVVNNMRLYWKVQHVWDWREEPGPAGRSVGRSTGRVLLVQPGLGAGGVGDELVGLEPQLDLGLGVLQGVAAVDDVPERRDVFNILFEILPLICQFLQLLVETLLLNQQRSYFRISML